MSKAIALKERIGFLERNLARTGGGAARFFGVRMEWDYLLSSSITQKKKGLQKLLPDFVASQEPWRVTFWFGAWDADAQCFYTEGCLAIPENNEKAMMNDIRRPERATEFG